MVCWLTFIVINIAHTHSLQPGEMLKCWLQNSLLRPVLTRQAVRYFLLKQPIIAPQGGINDVICSWMPHNDLFYKSYYMPACTFNNTLFVDRALNSPAMLRRCQNKIFYISITSQITSIMTNEIKLSIHLSLLQMKISNVPLNLLYACQTSSFAVNQNAW